MTTDHRRGPRDTRTAGRSADGHSGGRAAVATLGDATRRAIVELLAERPRSVGELASVLPVTRPAVSLHLKVLKDAGLITREQRGTWAWFTIDSARLAELSVLLS